MGIEALVAPNLIWAELNLRPVEDRSRAVCLPPSSAVLALYSVSFGMVDEKVPLVHACGHSYIKEAHHHFVIGLVSPMCWAVGIRIVGIVS